MSEYDLGHGYEDDPQPEPTGKQLDGRTFNVHGAGLLPANLQDDVFDTMMRIRHFVRCAATPGRGEYQAVLNSLIITRLVRTRPGGEDYEAFWFSWRRERPRYGRGASRGHRSSGSCATDVRQAGGYRGDVRDV